MRNLDPFPHKDLPGQEPPFYSENMEVLAESLESIRRATQVSSNNQLEETPKLPVGQASLFDNILRSVDEALKNESEEKARLRKMYPEILGDEDFSITTWKPPTKDMPVTKADILKIFRIKNN